MVRKFRGLFGGGKYFAANYPASTKDAAVVTMRRDLERIVMNCKGFFGVLSPTL